MFWLPFLDRDVYLQIVLLDCTQLEYKCKASANGVEVLNFVLDYLNIVERKYFGLRYLDTEDQVHWLDVKKPLKKQLKKCTEPYVFYFCIKFYAADPCDIQDDATKLEFFLQVWEEISRERLPVPFDELAELSARVLQYEIGDFNPVKHKPGYSAALTFAPEKNVRLEQKIECIHRTLRGLSSEETVSDFLDRARRLDLYGVELHPVVGEDDARYFLGLSPAGIMLVHNEIRVGMYDWDNVVRITKALDFRWKHSKSSRVQKGGTVLLSVRSVDDSLNLFGFRLATREACRHLWKTTNDYIRFFHEGDDIPVRTPSLSSRIFRRSEKQRSSSRAESEMMSLTSERRSIPQHPRVVRPNSLRRHDRPANQPTVIYEDEECTVIKDRNGNICQQLKLPPAVPAASRDLINLRVPSVASHYGPSTATMQRSHSPMSIQSSFSTNPRRFMEVKPVEPENDSDSVFSSSSRAISDADTLKRKRKRSVMTENASSGASEENDRGHTIPRGEHGRTSLGPQRRRGRNQMRFKTMDGSSIKSVLQQMQPQPTPMFTPVPIIQPAKSLNYLNSNTLNPPVTPSAKVLKEFSFKVESAKKPPTVFEFTAQQHSAFAFKFDAPNIAPLLSVPASLSHSTRSLRSLEVPKLSCPPVAQTEVDQAPRHSRSLSTSETTLPAVQNSRRARIRSDSHFSDVSGRGASPFASPFPIIPPPTPFSESDCSQQSPAVPPRPATNASPLASKLFGRRADRLIGTRSDSFNVAVTGADMEMHSLRHPAKSEPEVQENVYDAVYGECTAKQVVSVDVHRHSPPSGPKMESQLSIYDRPPLRESVKLESVGNSSAGLAASNEMYFDLTKLGNDEQKENCVPKPPRTKAPLKPVKAAAVLDGQNLGLSSNSVIMSHPLAMYSTDGIPNTATGNVPISRCGAMYEGRAPSSLLQSVYAHCSDYAASTDI